MKPSNRSAAFQDALSTGTMELGELRDAMVRYDGQQFATLYRGIRFMFRILPAEQGVEYTPASTGRARRETWRRIESVIERFNSIRSVHPGDYSDVTQNASYLLTLIRLRLRERIGGPESAAINPH
jgi:hypothetical protein